MEAEFGVEGVRLFLDPLEYGFVFRCITDRLSTLPEWEIKPRLGVLPNEAISMLDALLAAETNARRSGDHWMRPRPE